MTEADWKWVMLRGDRSIWNVLVHIFRSLTCNKRNFHLRSVSVKENVGFCERRRRHPALAPVRRHCARLDLLAAGRHGRAAGASTAPPRGIGGDHFSTCMLEASFPEDFKMIKTADLCSDRFKHLSLQISSVNLLAWTLFGGTTPLSATERKSH